MKHELRNASVITLGFLLVFLAGKLILNQNPGLSFWAWLVDTTPWHHTYLFGWLIMHGRFFYCALACVAPALWGWTRLSTTAFTGFTLGLLAGEVYHFLFWTSGQRGIPYSWVIWLITFLVSIVIGNLLQILKKKN